MSGNGFLIYEVVAAKSRQVYESASESSEAADHGSYFPNGESSTKMDLRQITPRQPGYLDSLPVRQCLTTKLIWGGETCLIW